MLVRDKDNKLILIVNKKNVIEVREVLVNKKYELNNKYFNSIAKVNQYIKSETFLNEVLEMNYDLLKVNDELVGEIDKLEAFNKRLIDENLQFNKLNYVLLNETLNYKQLKRYIKFMERMYGK